MGTIPLPNGLRAFGAVFHFCLAAQTAMLVLCALAATLAHLLVVRTLAEKAEDLITSLPGFPEAASWGFRAYSGLLDVPGPINGFDALRIHYQFHTSQHKPSDDPVLVWHQGGPGGSSIDIGLYGEMGAFQVGDKDHGNYMNPYAWNKIANMLYLESPAGSGEKLGYSQCIKGGRPTFCHWDDKTQALAYAHSLQAFFKAFPEFASNDFYLTGESYFGQYGPNIAHYILNNAPFNTSFRLKGIAAGNACWGGTDTCVACNGPSQDKLWVDFYYGKGLFSPKLKKQIDATCRFPTKYKPNAGGVGPFDCEAGMEGFGCGALLKKMHEEVGPHNIYNVYDNCPQTQAFLERTGKDSAWLASMLLTGLHNATATRNALREMNGGFDWDCGGNVGSWITSDEVRKALHLDQAMPGASGFKYQCSGPASITLWPELARKLRVLIYNGDADACVPYNGNQQWISELEEKGKLEETAPWKPWYAGASSPAGYLTRYRAPGSATDFTFATIRLAGHMAPTFQPKASLTMMRSFLGAGAAASVVEAELLV